MRDVKGKHTRVYLLSAFWRPVSVGQVGKPLLTVCDLSFTTSEKQPVRWPYSPMFFAYDCEQPSSWPSSRNVVMAWASRTQSPDAKPWYAMSKNGK